MAIQFFKECWQWAYSGKWSWVKWLGTVSAVASALLFLIFPTWAKQHLTDPINYTIKAIPAIGLFVFLARLFISPYFAWRTTKRELINSGEALEALKSARANESKSALYVELIEVRGILTVRVTNTQEREERILSVELSIENAEGMQESYGKINRFVRAQSVPHAMPPRSSFDIEYRLSYGALLSWGARSIQASIKTEDGRYIISEKYYSKEWNNPDNSNRKLLLACVDAIASGVSPLRALQLAKADELDTNDDLVRLCDDLVALGHPHPFEILEGEQLKPYWLPFLQAARLKALILGDSARDFEALQKVFLSERGKAEEKAPILTISFELTDKPFKNPTWVLVINLKDDRSLKIQSLKLIGIWPDREDSIIDQPGLFGDDPEPPCEIAPEDRKRFPLPFSADIWRIDKTLTGYYAELELKDSRTFRTATVTRPNPLITRPSDETS